MGALAQKIDLAVICGWHWLVHSDGDGWSMIELYTHIHTYIDIYSYLYIFIQLFIKHVYSYSMLFLQWFIIELPWSAHANDASKKSRPTAM